ncbi:hypothetical protein [Sphaerotilus uruguayifluvii]|uniref:Uncharacterized protein n=1 Tax=Sphaerotilus uruguayifluvii TaxID=2735897 RepID=A0ABX2FXR3_9BURK|nr:hypothetical protein [Leptothrix sp. C29]NRT54814.1 hypothetical protein [Leptothrix sp. C29]
MSVKAIRPDYHGDMKDSADHYRGQQLLYIGWCTKSRALRHRITRFETRPRVNQCQPVVPSQTVAAPGNQVWKGRHEGVAGSRSVLQALARQEPLSAQQCAPRVAQCLPAQLHQSPRVPGCVLI